MPAPEAAAAGGKPVAAGIWIRAAAGTLFRSRGPRHRQRQNVRCKRRTSKDGPCGFVVSPPTEDIPSI